MKKRKRKNIERAFTLRRNINIHHTLINLPQINDIKFTNDNLYFNTNTNKIQNYFISGIKTTYFKSNLINNKLNLQSDDLINGRTKKDVFVKTKRILLKPNIKQKNLLIIWMNTWIIMYNKVLSIIKNERKIQSEQANKSLQYNQLNMDNLALGKLKKDLKPFKLELVEKYDIDSHVLDNCIDTVLSMLKSSISNLKNKNCKKSKLRYIKKTKKSKIFKVELHSLQKHSFCTSKFGKIIKTKPRFTDFTKINDSITSIQYINGKFYMLAKKKVDIVKHAIKEQKVISLDPGHKTFLTGLSNDHLINIGNKVDKKIRKRLKKMDNIKKKRNKHPKYKRRNKRKHLLKHERKLANYINNLHWQTVNYLTTNYNHILLGNYSTKEMVESEKTLKMNKRIGSSLKFYQFRQKLIYKCLLRDCKFGLIDEYNTSKACSNCSSLYKIGKSRKYECKQCLHSYPRDINSSKNILLRSITN